MSLFSTGAALIAVCITQQAPRHGVISYKNIALYPITTGLSNIPADIITLDEGIKDGTITITETGNIPGLVRPRPGGGGGFQNGGAGFGGSRPAQQQQRYGGAQVNTLWLTNTSGKTLLLVAGEMLLGGQQDRIVQKDGLIPPSKAPVDLAVFCVEHGRWTANSTQFGGLATGRAAGAAGGFGGGGGAFAAPSGGRGAAVMAKGQTQVWDSVAAQTRKLGNESATGTYRENYLSQKTRPVMDDYVNALMARFPVQEASGVVVAVNGKLIWMDRFDTRRTFAKYWPKLLKSYVLEAAAEQDKAFTNPSYGEAMRYAMDRRGRASFEGEEGVSKLTKVESDTTILYELEDLQSNPGIIVHANKATKQ